MTDATQKETPFTPYHLDKFSPEEQLERSRKFYASMNGRRTVRHFSNEPVEWEVIENIIRTASTAPSGAHKQPWTFCVVGDPELKAQIRKAAEEEEYRNYHGRMSEEWLEDLEPFGTDWHKEFLEVAPYLIVVMKRAYEEGNDGEKKNNYYANESVGIATGMLIAAAHHSGLATLTHTPSPMNFLAKILQRPDNERPYLLIPIGRPAEGCTVPALERKPLEQVLQPYI